MPSYCILDRITLISLMSLILNSGHPTPMKASKFIHQFATSTDPLAEMSEPVIRQIEINKTC